MIRQLLLLKVFVQLSLIVAPFVAIGTLASQSTAKEPSSLSLSAPCVTNINDDSQVSLPASIVDEVAELVAKLDSDSFATRRRATDRLIRLAVNGRPDDRSRMIKLVFTEASSRSFETQCLAETLASQIEDSCLRSDLAIIRASLPVTSTNPQQTQRNFSYVRLSVAPDLYGSWQSYRRLAGTDEASFEVFEAVAQSRQFQAGPASATAIRLTGEASLAQIAAVVALHGHSQANAFFRNRFFVDDQDNKGSMRITMRRLVAHALCANQVPLSIAERLQIATAYQDRDFVAVASRRIHANVSSTPQLVAAAMLAKLTLKIPVCDQQLVKMLADGRVVSVTLERKAERPPRSSHRPKAAIAPAGASRVITQVRDVAMVVALSQRGIDPREFGFRHLKADRQTTYLAKSLGFVSGSERKNALARITVDLEAGRLVIEH